MKQNLLCTLAAYAAAASAVLTRGRYSSRMAILPVPGLLLERQVHICLPVEEPVTCARSCGAGFIQCIAFPHCYSPGRGDICCSDGSHCPTGTYCTDNACCPDGTPLSECGATISLSTIPNPATSTSASTSTSTSTSISASTSTSRSSYTSTASSTSKSTSTSTATTSVISTSAYTTGYLPSASIVTSPNISTTSTVVPFTGGAVGMGWAYSGVGVVLGGVAMLAML